MHIRIINKRTHECEDLLINDTTNVLDRLAGIKDRLLKIYPTKRFSIRIVL
jgi:hypothetical protein